MGVTAVATAIGSSSAVKVNETPAPERGQTVAKVKAVTKIQSLIRRIHARQFIVQTFKKDGLLVAMPGTIQNSSGWYEMPPDQTSKATQVVRFEVSNGDWTLSDGPMSKADWMATQAKANRAKWGPQ